MKIKVALPLSLIFFLSINFYLNAGEFGQVVGDIEESVGTALEESGLKDAFKASDMSDDEIEAVQAAFKEEGEVFGKKLLEKGVGGATKGLVTKFLEKITLVLRKKIVDLGENLTKENLAKALREATLATTKSLRNDILDQFPDKAAGEAAFDSISSEIKDLPLPRATLKINIDSLKDFAQKDIESFSSFRKMTMRLQRGGKWLLKEGIPTAAKTGLEKMKDVVVNGLMMGFGFTIPNWIMAAFSSLLTSRANANTILAPQYFGGIWMRIPETLLNEESPNSTPALYCRITDPDMNSFYSVAGGSGKLSNVGTIDNLNYFTTGGECANNNWGQALIASAGYANAPFLGQMIHLNSGLEFYGNGIATNLDYPYRQLMGPDDTDQINNCPNTIAKFLSEFGGKLTSGAPFIENYNMYQGNGLISTYGGGTKSLTLGQLLWASEQNNIMTLKSFTAPAGSTASATPAPALISTIEALKQSYSLPGGIIIRGFNGMPQDQQKALLKSVIDGRNYDPYMPLISRGLLIYETSNTPYAQHVKNAYRAAAKIAQVNNQSQRASDLTKAADAVVDYVICGDNDSAGNFSTLTAAIAPSILFQPIQSKTPGSVIWGPNPQVAYLGSLLSNAVYEPKIDPKTQAVTGWTIVPGSTATAQTTPLMQANQPGQIGALLTAIAPQLSQIFFPKITAAYNAQLSSGPWQYGPYILVAPENYNFTTGNPPSGAPPVYWLSTRYNTTSTIALTENNSVKYVDDFVIPLDMNLNYITTSLPNPLHTYWASLVTSSIFNEDFTDPGPVCASILAYQSTSSVGCPTAPEYGYVLPNFVTAPSWTCPVPGCPSNCSNPPSASTKQATSNCCCPAGHCGTSCCTDICVDLNSLYWYWFINPYNSSSWFVEYLGYQIAQDLYELFSSPASSGNQNFDVWKEYYNQYVSSPESGVNKYRWLAQKLALLATAAFSIPNLQALSSLTGVTLDYRTLYNAFIPPNLTTKTTRAEVAHYLEPLARTIVQGIITILESMVNPAMSPTQAQQIEAMSVYELIVNQIKGTPCPAAAVFTCNTAYSATNVFINGASPSQDKFDFSLGLSKTIKNSPSAYAQGLESWLSTSPNKGGKNYLYALQQLIGNYLGTVTETTSLNQAEFGMIPTANLFIYKEMNLFNSASLFSAVSAQSSSVNNQILNANAQWIRSFESVSPSSWQLMGPFAFTPDVILYATSLHDIKQNCYVYKSIAFPNDYFVVMNSDRINATGTATSLPPFSVAVPFVTTPFDSINPPTYLVSIKTGYIYSVSGLTILPLQNPATGSNAIVANLNEIQKSLTPALQHIVNFVNQTQSSSWPLYNFGSFTLTRLPSDVVKNIQLYEDVTPLMALFPPDKFNKTAADLIDKVTNYFIPVVTTGGSIQVASDLKSADHILSVVTGIFYTPQGQPDSTVTATPAQVQQLIPAQSTVYPIILKLAEQATPPAAIQPATPPYVLNPTTLAQLAGSTTGTVNGISAPVPMVPYLPQQAYMLLKFYNSKYYAVTSPLDPMHHPTVTIVDYMFQNESAFISNTISKTGYGIQYSSTGIPLIIYDGWVLDTMRKKAGIIITGTTQSLGVPNLSPPLDLGQNNPNVINNSKISTAALKGKNNASQTLLIQPFLVGNTQLQTSLEFGNPATYAGYYSGKYEIFTYVSPTYGGSQILAKYTPHAGSMETPCYIDLYSGAQFNENGSSIIADYPVYTCAAPPSSSNNSGNIQCPQHISVLTGTGNIFASWSQDALPGQGEYNGYYYLYNFIGNISAPTSSQTTPSNYAMFQTTANSGYPYMGVHPLNYNETGANTSLFEVSFGGYVSEQSVGGSSCSVPNVMDSWSSNNTGCLNLGNIFNYQFDPTMRMRFYQYLGSYEPSNSNNPNAGAQAQKGNFYEGGVLYNDPNYDGWNLIIGFTQNSPTVVYSQAPALSGLPMNAYVPCTLQKNGTFVPNTAVSSSYAITLLTRAATGNIEFTDPQTGADYIKVQDVDVNGKTQIHFYTLKYRVTDSSTLNYLQQQLKWHICSTKDGAIGLFEEIPLISLLQVQTVTNIPSYLQNPPSTFPVSRIWFDEDRELYLYLFSEADSNLPFFIEGYTYMGSPPSFNYVDLGSGVIYQTVNHGGDGVYLVPTGMSLLSPELSLLLTAYSISLPAGGARFVPMGPKTKEPAGTTKINAWTLLGGNYSETEGYIVTPPKIGQSKTLHQLGKPYLVYKL